ncbi:MAG: beta-galactosidase trimerization domain-containing protein [Lentisphaeria bacterium]|nr:beta-galactosidase trimerization domain-containing protein [Lentisphaeria bacterium]
MRFRQIHLDFHNSPLVPIGDKFDKAQFQKGLKLANADSITCFSLCHHGLSYHPTKIGVMHPNLKFDLLRAQIDAAHEIGVKVPIYLTCGVNEVAFNKHPEWMTIDYTGHWAGWTKSPLEPGFHKLCLNTAYMDYFCALLEEAMLRYPDADGIFTDIIVQNPCCCPRCMEGMLAAGLNPAEDADRRAFARQVIMNYYRRTEKTVHDIDPNMRLFHNSGDIPQGDTEILPFFTHLEAESLPTGGWGYDHFPMSAAYCRNLGYDFTGMTGKFHTTWGEFGGFKHPNALRFECAAMLANGAGCSIGDQLHPSGLLDESTCALIGTAYREVEEKEPWCRNVSSAAKIGVLGSKMFQKAPGGSVSDTGICRFLLENHLPFDFILPTVDFSAYDLLILPESENMPEELIRKVARYVEDGGKILGSFKAVESGLFPEVEDHGPGEFKPDYLCAAKDFAPYWVHTPFISYGTARKFKAIGKGISIGDIHYPYFQRNYKHFSSHAQTPFDLNPSGYSAGVITDNRLCFAHNIFALYAAWGNAAFREFIGNALKKLLGDRIQVRGNFLAQERLSLLDQKEEKRLVFHLLYGPSVKRGGKFLNRATGEEIGSSLLEIIEDLPPAPAVDVDILCDKEVVSVKVAISGKELPFTLENDRLKFTAPGFECHEIIEINYK